MAVKYNTKLIKARDSYTVQEIAELFGVNKRSCFRWIKEGLKVVQENTNPLLIMGYELKRFLSEKQQSRKISLQPDEFFCCKCHKAVKVKTGSEQVVETGKKIGKSNKEQLKRIAVCEDCGTKVNRFL